MKIFYRCALLAAVFAALLQFSCQQRGHASSEDSSRVKLFRAAAYKSGNEEALSVIDSLISDARQGRLTPRESEILRDLILEIQRDAKGVLWTRELGRLFELVNTSPAAGRYWTVFIQQSFLASPALRKRVRQGDPLIGGFYVEQIRGDSDPRFATFGINGHVVVRLGKLSLSSEFNESRYEGPWTLSDGGFSAPPMTSPEWQHYPVGKYVADVEVVVHVTRHRGESAVIRLQQALPLQVLPPNQPSVSLDQHINAELMRAKLGGSLPAPHKPEEIRLGRQRPYLGLLAFNGPPCAVAFGVRLRQNQVDVPIGRHTQVPTRRYPWGSWLRIPEHDRNGFDVLQQLVTGPAEIVLEASPKAASETVDIEQIWGGRLTIPITLRITNDND